MIKLFDVLNGVIVPTEHCYNLKTLKAVMDEYSVPEEYMPIYSYLFYMACPNPDLNPFFDMPEHDKEEAIIDQLNIGVSLDDPVIVEALAFCKKLYETPTYRAYEGIKSMLDNLAIYMRDTNITDGRDGNITALVNAAKNFEAIRVSFRGAYKDLKDEQKSSVRGGARLGYDQ